MKKRRDAANKVAIVSAKPFLMDIPEEVMAIITSSCDWPAIQSLRKTCHALRDFTDIDKYKKPVSAITIKRKRNSVLLEFCVGKEQASVGRQSLYPNGPRISLEYSSHPSGCMVSMEQRKGKKKQRIVKEANYMKVFWGDFKTLLSQRHDTPLQNFKLDSDLLPSFKPGKGQMREMREFLAEFPKTVRLHGLLKTTAFSIKIEKGDQFADILPVLDSAHLKKLHVSPIMKYGHPNWSWMTIWDFFKLSKTLQWKSARELILTDIEAFLDVEDILHFTKVDIRNHTINNNQFRTLMKSFFKSCNTEKKFDIRAYWPGSDVQIQRQWVLENRYYYRSRHTELILAILFSRKLVKMELMKQSKVPHGQMIRDFDAEDVEKNDEEKEDGDGGKNDKND